MWKATYIPQNRTELVSSKQSIAAMARMATTLLRLFVILLGLSHLLTLQAIPVTRTENLMQVPQNRVALENTHKITTDQRNLELEEGSTITERMDLELHDYPPSGPNNRHTPRAP